MNKEREPKNKKLPAFYIALCFCVLMIGVAGYLTQKHTDEPASAVKVETDEKTDTAPVFSNDFGSLTLPTYSPTPTEAPTPSPEVTEAPAEASPEPTDAPITDAVMDYTIDNPDLDGGALTVTAEQPAFIMPVNGEVIEPFTDRLAYNVSLGDWRAHGGIDIAAEKGCSVQASAQGVVERVYDNAMGSCVELSHASGFVTRYMGLVGTEDLFEGKEIKSGEVIGTSGECKGENTSAPHIHFEMEKDGVAVDPSEYLPE